MTFQTERPAPRDEVVTLRVSAMQNEKLVQLAERMGIAKSEVLRLALDYWLDKSPEAAAATAAPKKKR